MFHLLVSQSDLPQEQAESNSGTVQLSICPSIHQMEELAQKPLTLDLLIYCIFTLLLGQQGNWTFCLKNVHFD